MSQPTAEARPWTLKYQQQSAAAGLERTDEISNNGNYDDLLDGAADINCNNNDKCDRNKVHSDIESIVRWVPGGVRNFRRR